jgi:hypothetical protein
VSGYSGAGALVRPEHQFHVGIVVDDLDAALAQLTDLFGYRWCDEIAVPTDVALPTGGRVVDFRFAYSMDAPRLEIIQSIPGTLWTPVADSGVHHLGYWCDDVDGASAALERSGLAREAAGVQPDGSATWAYHRAASGPRIELVSASLRPLMERWWAV